MTEDRDYHRLARKYLPRPIHAVAQYQEAFAVLNRLASCDEETLTAAETDYLDALSMFIARYDEEQVPEPPPGSPLTRLRYLVESAGMSASDLGRILGNRGLGSTLLAGKRELSKNHIRILADHFHLDAAYFL